MAYGMAIYECGHEEIIHGQGVVRDSVNKRSGLCSNCSHIVKMIKGEVGVNSSSREAPFDHLPWGEIARGKEFSYKISFGVEVVVKCEILSITHLGGELTSTTRESFSIGGKTEQGASRGNYSTKYSLIRVLVELSIKGVEPFEVERRIKGHR